MRIRPIWITVPACAAAGVVTYSYVAAQEATPRGGFHQTKVTAHPSVIAEQNRSYAQPLPGTDAPTRPTTTHSTQWAPPGGTTPARLAGAPPQATPGNGTQGRLTQPAVAGPAPSGVITAGGNEAEAPRGRYFPDSGQSAPTIRQASATGEPITIPPPDLTVPVMENRRPGVAGPNLPPPKVTLESESPAPGRVIAPPKPKLDDAPKALPSISVTPPAPTVANPVTNPPAATPDVPAGPAMRFPATPVVKPETKPSEPAMPVGDLTLPETGPVLLTPDRNAPPRSQTTPPAQPTLPESTFPDTPLPARQSPNLVLETVAPESIGVGLPLTYELVVRNTGTDAVANVRVEDHIPAGAKFLGSDPNTELVGRRLSWTVGTLDAGAEKRIKITVKPAEEGEMRNRAMVTFSTATETTIKVTRPRVNVTLVAGEAARVGEEVPFQIKVANTGSGPAHKLVIQAKLSDGLQHPQGSVIEAELENVPPGETKTVTLRAIAAKAGAQSCVIAVVADNNPAETTQSTLNVVEPLLVTKLVGPNRCLVNSEPTYALELSNPGTANTDPVQAVAMIPEGFEFLSASDGGTFTPTTRTVVWKMPALGQGSQRTLTFKVRATTPFEGTLRSVAQAVPPVQDPGMGSAVQNVAYRAPAGRVLESRSEAPVKSEGVPALRFEVYDVEDPVQVGKDAVYEIKVVNQGTGPCTNVQVQATLADGTQITGASGHTAGQGQGQVVTFEPIASLDAKKEAHYQVRIRGGQKGDMRFKVQITCDQIKTPIVKEENTRFFSE